MERKSDVGSQQQSCSDYSMMNESFFINEQLPVSKFFCEDEVIGQIRYPKSVSPDKFNFPSSRLKDYPAVSESYEWPKSGKHSKLSKVSKVSNESNMVRRNSNWEAIELIRSTEDTISEDFKGKDLSVIQLYTERNRWNEVLNQITPENIIKGSSTLSALYKLCTILFKLHHRTEILVKEQQETQKEETMKLKTMIKEQNAILRKFEGKEKREAEFKAVQDAKIRAEIEELFGPDEGDFDQKKAQRNLDNYKESGITECLHELLGRLSKAIDIPQKGYLNFSSVSPEDIHSSLQSKLLKITQTTVAKVTKSLIKKPELEDKYTSTEDKLIDKYLYDELQAKYDKYETQYLLVVKQKDRMMEELKEARIGLDKVTFEKKALVDNIENLKKENIVFKELKQKVETKLEEATAKYEICTNMNLSLEKQLSELNGQILAQSGSISQLQIDLQHAIHDKTGIKQLDKYRQDVETVTQKEVVTKEIKKNQNINRKSVVEFVEYSDSELSDQSCSDASPKAPQEQREETAPKSAASNTKQSTTTMDTYQDSTPKITKLDQSSLSQSKETIKPKRTHRSQRINKTSDIKDSKSTSQHKESRVSNPTSNPPDAPSNRKTSKIRSGDSKPNSQDNVDSSKTSSAISSNITQSNRKTVQMKQDDSDSHPIPQDKLDFSLVRSVIPSKISQGTDSLPLDNPYQDEIHSRTSIVTGNPEPFDLRESVDLSSISRVSYQEQSSDLNIISDPPLEDLQHVNLPLPLNEAILGKLSNSSLDQSSIILQKPVISVKCSLDSSQRKSISNGYSQPTDSPLNSSKQPINRVLKSSGIDSKHPKKELESKNITKSVYNNSYIDRGSDFSYDLIWQRVNENSKAVQYSQDFPEFNSVDNGENKKEYIFSFNPNNVFGLKGDVYYQGFQKVFQAMPSGSDNTGKNLYKRTQDISKNIV